MESQYLAEATSVINGCVTQLLGLIAQVDGWKDLGDNDGVRGSQTTTPDGKQLIRSIGILNFSPEQLAAFIFDNSKKKSWDGMLDESSIVVSFSDSFRIMYERFAAPWPVSYRDFVFACRSIQRDDGILLVAKSIEAGVAEKSGVVRGELITSGFYLKRLGENVTEMTYLVCMDPKGMLPGFIVNQLGKKQCLNVNKIRHVMGKPS